MRITRIAVILFLGILLASGFACGPKPVFEVTNLTISPTEVGLEQTVTVTADVENIGGAEGNYTVELKIDGAIEDSDQVTLAVGETETLAFTFTRTAEGTYNVSVDGLTATVTVEEGVPPTLSVGDEWVYAMTSDSNLYTWTYEVTGQETIGGKDCYVGDISIEPAYMGTLSSVRVWFEKETFWVLKIQMPGELMGPPYIATTDISYEGPPLFPLEVGKEVEVTETGTTTITMLGETETETKTYTRTYRVEKIEDITVTAGTFRCFKIVQYDEYGTALLTTWYSDKVKSSEGVKNIDPETGETRELESYSVQ